MFDIYTGAKYKDGDYEDFEFKAVQPRSKTIVGKKSKKKRVDQEEAQSESRGTGKFPRNSKKEEEIEERQQNFFQDLQNEMREDQVKQSLSFGQDRKNNNTVVDDPARDKIKVGFQMRQSAQTFKDKRDQFLADYQYLDVDTLQYRDFFQDV